MSEEIFVASDGVKLAYRYDDFTDPWAKAPFLVLIHSGMCSAVVPPRDACTCLLTRT